MSAGVAVARHMGCSKADMEAPASLFALARRAVLVSAALLSLPLAFAAPAAGIAILHAAPWSAADAAREGAGEFEVLLRVAQLRRTHPVAGLISVGDRN